MKLGLLIKKYSPEILVTLGLISGGGALVTAILATTKAEDALDAIRVRTEETKAELALVEEDTRKDLMNLYIQNSIDLLKLYWPTLTLSALSIGFILTGMNIMKKRNLAVMAAYKVLEESARTRSKPVLTESIDENGNTVFLESPDESTIGGYWVTFDATSNMWDYESDYVFTFLQSVEDEFNDLLSIPSRGHVMVNEVLDRLDIKRTSEGTVLGWVDDGTPHKLKLGIPENQDIENGVELYFNIDGIVYDLI